MTHFKETGVWKGMPHYSCVIEGCPYDSTNPEVMESHWERHHQSQTRMVATGILDASGRPVIRETED